jgi:hypothetical protein
VIERPKRAVTRFFIPLIDVLILLFCIFLLMPFMDAPTSADSSEADKKLLTRGEMREQIDNLRIDLDKARREVKQLQDERQNPSEKFSVLALDIDPKDGKLFYYRYGKRLEVTDERTAQEVIDDQKRRSGVDKEPFFVILLPRVESGAPSRPQLRAYHSWFKGVPHKFDSPLGILPPELEDKR